MSLRWVAFVGLALVSLAAHSGPEDPQEGGKWAPPVSWPFVPVSAATLPDGRILGWASNERMTFPAGPERTYTAIWDPQSGQMNEILHPTHDMFCGNQVMLEDGTVYVTGGRNQGNSPWTSLFDYRTNQWTQRENMNRGRWYPTSVALPNGNVFIAIGEGGGNTGELWDGASQWRLLSGINFDLPILNYSSASFGERNWTPLMQLAPDGRIFHLGPTPKMHMIDTTGVGSITQVGPQITGWYPKDSATVVYDAGKIVVAGGWTAGNNTVSSNRAMVIDVNGAAPAVTNIGNMNAARRFHNGVTLPNGEVVFIGGNTSGEKFSDVGSVLAVELWNPTTQMFRLGASMSVPRNYHSVALLMIDGRVWSGGGGLCGCSADHPDAQIWSPPYLFNADGTNAVRPELYSAPGVVAAGSSITVRGTAGLTKFSMVKMSTETHSNNTDMRFLNATFQNVAAGEYRVNLHGNTNVLTPGYWMLFGLNAQGVPSVAKVFQVSTQGVYSGPPVIRAVSNLNQAKNAAVDMTLNVVEPDGDPLTFSATGLPPGVVLGAQSGRLAGTLTTAGTYAVSISVADAQGSATTSFTWRVTENPGVAYEYYTGSFDVLPNFDALTPVKTGVVSNFTLAPRTQEDFYAFRYRGRIDIATAGSYRFFTSSDDGSKLLINGALVVNNDGLHGTQERFGDVTLGVGAHTIEVTYFEKTGGATLTVSYQGPGITKQLIPDSALTQPPPPNQAPVVTNPGDQAGIVGQNVTLNIAANDPNGDALSFSATGLPAGLSIHPTSGAITGALTAAGVHSTRVDVFDGSLTTSVTFTWSVSAPNVPPTITPIANKVNVVGDVVSFTVSANDANGDPLTYSATGLPPGLSINATTGLISGTIGPNGSYAVTVTVRDFPNSEASTSFSWTVNNPVVPLTIQPIQSPPREAGVPVAFTVSATGSGALSYRWSYGDGSPLESFTSSPNRTHTYASPGRYVVTATVRDDVTEQSSTFTQAIYAAHTVGVPAQDSTIIYESVTGTPRVWNVNPDSNSVTVINATTLAKIAEVAVGTKPMSLGLGGDGRIWVANKRSASITRIDPASRLVVDQLMLPRGSAPHALVIDPVSGDALVVLEGLGRLVRIDDATGTIVGQRDLGANVRHLSVSGDGNRIYVARFITPPLPGEHTAAPSLTRNGQPVGGEVLVIDGVGLNVVNTVVLPHSNATVSEHSGPGLPNYLRAPTLSLDGQSAWVPSKQDNILRGTLRSGQPLDHDHTVRAITSRIDLATATANLTSRIDHDNASIPSAAAFDATGSYLFVALEGNRMIAAVDAYRGEELFRFAAGRAPEGLVMDPAGRRLFVQNLMDRTVTVHDLSALIDTGSNMESRLATISTVSVETLPPAVLLGKQHFYDSLDGRLAKESYMSCAACHNDGGHDGRTWDFTGFGEGLRNTATLDGQGGTANGPVHWTGNFDEIQDFEGQIRSFVLGFGLMSDVHFNAGTRSQPLGDPKAGLSPDLDALAAYLASLNAVAASPHRTSSGLLTAAGEAGKTVFVANNCASCHSGNGFTDSAINVRHDVGTIKSTSGGRLGGALDGFDTPTLRGLWATAPYLHDGSASTLADAIDAHSGFTLSTTDRDNLVSYLQQIDATEPAAVGPAPKLEALMVSGVSSAGWTVVPLASRYQSMVAVCTLHQTTNTIPQVVRMRQLADDRFEIRLQNPQGGALAGEKVYCLAAEAGNWRLPDGRRFEAKRYQSTRVDRSGSWVGELRSYGQTYTSPVVLGQVMSYNDTRWSAFWTRGTNAKNPPSSAALYTGYAIGQDTATTRISETIGYMVIEAGSGSLGGVLYEAKVGSDIVRGWDNNTTGYTYTFTRSYPGPRLAVVSQAAMDGNDGSFASIRGGSAGLTSTAMRLVADEDRIKDAERSHTTEQVGYLVIDQPVVVTLTPAP